MVASGISVKSPIKNLRGLLDDELGESDFRSEFELGLGLELELKLKSSGLTFLRLDDLGANTVSGTLPSTRLTGTSHESSSFKISIIRASKRINFSVSSHIIQSFLFIFTRASTCESRPVSASTVEKSI
jgi:hypothetical protein